MRSLVAVALALVACGPDNVSVHESTMFVAEVGSALRRWALYPTRGAVVVAVLGSLGVRARF